MLLNSSTLFLFLMLNYYCYIILLYCIIVSQESERYSRTHWTSVIVESGVPKTFSYKQERTVIGALLL